MKGEQEGGRSPPTPLLLFKFCLGEIFVVEKEFHVGRNRKPRGLIFLRGQNPEAMGGCLVSFLLPDEGQICGRSWQKA